MGNTNSFGNVPLLKGWDFKPSDYHNSLGLLTAQIENTNLCNLDCEYCFRGGSSSDEKKRFDKEISRSQLFHSIEELAELGVKTINIIGAGEPLLDPAMGDLLKYISSFNITPVIATNGSRITTELIETFDRTGSSIIIKMNSLNNDLQNRLVRRNWFADRRDYGLRLLIESRFNKPSTDYQTRLGINSIVFQENKNEIYDIFRYCRNNNIMPLMSTFIPAGRTKDKTDKEVSMEEFLKIGREIQKIDREIYGINYNRLLPYLGGVPCTQCGKSSLYLTISGDISDCPGQLHTVGNIRDISISEGLRRLRERGSNPEFSCPARLNYWKQIGQLVDLDKY
ncbi:7-carboxy-7-deazaguanine synthase [uncultured archaeon]|nr:7-carboxy-7-deazaguanine synthase [uncultured archaeon]